MREIYAWKDGYYQSGADQDIEFEVKRELQEFYEVKWFTIVYNHIVAKGSIHLWEFKEQQPKRTVNIEKGILVYKDNDKKVKFYPRRSRLDFCDYNFTYKLAVNSNKFIINDHYL